MEAFVLAAGLGTRLKPFTDHCPKALITVNGTTLLELNLRNLIQQGATRIVVNVHHFAEQITNFINSHSWEAEILISDESDMLLDTGGGLKKAEALFSKKEPILVHNVDILSRIDFGAMVSQHSESKSIATLAVSRRDTSRQLLFNNSNQLIGWHNETTDEYKWSSARQKKYNNLAFSGISVIQPQLLDLLPEALQPYSIITAYLQLSNMHHIGAFCHNQADWIDVGKPETLAMAQHFLHKPQPTTLWKHSFQK